MGKSFIRTLVNAAYPTPWVVEDLLLKKYYGTRILDANGNEVATFGLDGAPSSRWVELYGPGVWHSHYESDKTLALCEYLVGLVNQDVGSDE